MRPLSEPWRLPRDLAEAHASLAFTLMYFAWDFAGAEREFRRALELNANLPTAHQWLAYLLTALEAVRSALEMNAAFPPAFFWLGRIHTSLGRYDAAREALQRLGPLRSWTPAMAVLGYLYAKSGQPANARAILGEFDALAASGRYASAYAIGAVHAGLGDRERALASLAQAYRERSHWLVWLKRDQRWNDVRADQRFQQLVGNVGLPR